MKAMFSFITEYTQAAALDLAYHLAPWDRPIFGAETAVISDIAFRQEEGATPVFDEFRDWCARHRAVLVTCRLEQSQLRECAFLEARGFRFIELNYRPDLEQLAGFAPDPDILIAPASLEDFDVIVGYAGQIFEAGRFHLDPWIGPEIGNRRYAAWAANAFRHPNQQVLKCIMEQRLVAFFVVEQTDPQSRLWSLFGLAPGMAGRGLGQRMWRALVANLRNEGVTSISTSISSHNVAMHGLCVSLGFRFPAPSVVLHWCPLGPVSIAPP
jgi:RimJ/RimL family protein N-acetyltransferase